MRYFYDTEFIEDGKTIDLVSIGIVCEDGREYYAISHEYDETKADDWVKKNVLLPIDLDSKIRVSRNEIKKDILSFCNPKLYGKPEFWAYYSADDHIVLCQLFGKMIDLPEGWPMHTNDIKQLCNSIGNPQLPKQDGLKHRAIDEARWNKQAYDFLINYSLVK